MKTFNIAKEENCSLVNELRAELQDKYAMLIPSNLIEGLYRCFFRSFALIVKYNTKKDGKKTSFSLKNNNGEFIIGTVLKYEVPESEDEEGHYNLSMTFDESEIENSDNKIDSYNNSFFTIVQSEMYADMKSHCTSNSDLLLIIIEFVNALKSFLDHNSNNSTEDVSIEIDTVLTATVSINKDGNKDYAIIPGSAIKQVVKDDEEV